MISEIELQDKLQHWIREYGPGGYPTEQSRNLLQTLVDHRGFVPNGGGFRNVPINTIGDEVESAVREMCSRPEHPGEENLCFKAGMVLRAYYLTPVSWAEDDRLHKLKRIGLPMQRSVYYRLVQVGRAFLMGYLSQREAV